MSHTPFFVSALLFNMGHTQAKGGYKNNHHIMMVLNPYPNKNIEHVKTLPDGTKHFASVCFNVILGGVLYFAILY